MLKYFDKKICSLHSFYYKGYMIQDHYFFMPNLFLSIYYDKNRLVLMYLERLLTVVHLELLLAIDIDIFVSNLSKSQPSE